MVRGSWIISPEGRFEAAYMRDIGNEISSAVNYKMVVYAGVVYVIK